MGNASQPITQQECNKSPCQGKRTTPTLILFYRMGKSASRHRKGALRDYHSLKFHTANGNWAYEAGGNGGPLMTLKGEAIHIFIMPTGVRPGAVLQVLALAWAGKRRTVHRWSTGIPARKRKIGRKP